MMSLTKAVFAVLGLTLATATPVASQSPAGPGPARVTLVAGPAPTRGGRTEVVRQANRAPRNIVIVDRSATPEDLGAALTLLNALRLKDGDSLSTDFRARPRSFRTSAAWQSSEYRRWLVEQLVRLRRAPDRQVATYGMAKAVEIILPAPTGTVSGPTGKE